jgi:hypothetical protein
MVQVLETQGYLACSFTHPHTGVTLTGGQSQITEDSRHVVRGPSGYIYIQTDGHALSIQA